MRLLFLFSFSLVFAARQAPTNGAVSQSDAMLLKVKSILSTDKIVDISYADASLELSFPLANPMLSFVVSGGVNYAGPNDPTGSFEALSSGTISIGVGVGLSEFFKLKVTLDGSMNAASTFAGGEEGVRHGNAIAKAVRPLKVFAAHVTMSSLESIGRRLREGVAAMRELWGKISFGERDVRALEEFLAGTWAPMMAEAERMAAQPGLAADNTRRHAFWRLWAKKLQIMGTPTGWFAPAGRAGLNRVLTRVCRHKVGIMTTAAWRAVVGSLATAGASAAEDAGRFAEECSRLVAGGVIDRYDSLEWYVRMAAARDLGSPVGDPALLGRSMAMVTKQLSDLVTSLKGQGALARALEGADRKIAAAMTAIRDACAEVIRKEDVELRYQTTLTVTFGATTTRPITGASEAFTVSAGGGMMGWVNPKNPRGVDTSPMMTATAVGSITRGSGFGVEGSVGISSLTNEAATERVYGVKGRLQAASLSLKVTFPRDYGLAKGFTLLQLARSPFVFDNMIRFGGMATTVARGLMGKIPGKEVKESLVGDAKQFFRNIAANLITIGPGAIALNLIPSKLTLQFQLYVLFNKSGYFKIVEDGLNYSSVLAVVVSDLAPVIPPGLAVLGSPPTLTFGAGIQIPWKTLKKLSGAKDE